MAKKYNKPNLPQETLQRARQELYGEVPVTHTEVEPSKQNAARPIVTKTVRREVNLRVEYAYVMTDLKNMAILASGLMLVLIALSFVI